MSKKLNNNGEQRQKFQPLLFICVSKNQAYSG